MNRLWVRLSLAFSSVVLIATAAIIGIGGLIVQTNIQPYLVLDTLRTPNGLIATLGGYYEKHGGWLGVDMYIDGALAALRPLTGETLNAVLIPASSAATPCSAPSGDAVALPIQTAGQLRACLQITGLNSQTFSGQPQFGVPGLPNFLIVIVAAGGIGGIAFGVVMSRGLTAPLSRLAAAAHAIGDRDLSRRVSISGSSEIVALAHAFNEMAAKLEQGEALRRNLVADVAHELRTPLSVLQGNLRAMLDNVYPLDQVEVARLYDQTRMLNRLINDLHELTLAEAHQLPLKRVLTNVSHILSSASSAFAPLAEMEGVQLVVTPGSDLPLVLADSFRLTQILHNLLVNALRHTPSGGTISLAADTLPTDHTQVRITVRDTGEGISAEHLPFVFERFYRADRARSRATGGAGLGLAIVRALVESHNGQIVAASDGIAGHGTAFTIMLPAESQTVA